MTRTRILPPLAALLALSAAVRADDTPAPAPATPPAATAPATPSTDSAAPLTYTLRYKFTPGEVRRYKMSTVMTGQIFAAKMNQAMPFNEHMDSIVRLTVQSVKPDGTATLTYGVESMSGTINGQPLPDMSANYQKMTSTLTMSPQGKILSMKMAGQPAAPSGMNMNQFTQFNIGNVLPTGPVKIGDTWKTPLSMAGLGLKGNVVSTLKSVDTSGNNPVAVIGQTQSGTLNFSPKGSAAPMPMSMSGTFDGSATMNVDTGAGAIASSDGKVNTVMSMTITPPGQGPTKMRMRMNMTQTMTRLPESNAGGTATDSLTPPQ